MVTKCCSYIESRVAMSDDSVAFTNSYQEETVKSSKITINAFDKTPVFEQHFKDTSMAPY